jgi:hypothetical protein
VAPWDFFVERSSYTSTPEDAGWNWLSCWIPNGQTGKSLRPIKHLIADNATGSLELAPRVSGR